MQKRVVLVALVGLIGSLGLPRVASASSFDLASLIPNIGFESGLAGWDYTGATVNPNTYLTVDEWGAQTWFNSSSVYTDAELAVLYPGQPWGLTPDITHVQQSGGPVDPTVVVGAAVGNNFVGSREDGDPPSFDDRNFQLRYTLVTPFLSSGDVISLTTWGNRGRLNGNFGVENGSSTLTFRLFGEAGTSDFNQTCTFSNWGVDGAWASQVCTWTLNQNPSFIRLFVTGQNSNHDRYVAVDMGTANVPAPEPASMALLGSGLVGLAAAVRRRRSAKRNS